MKPHVTLVNPAAPVGAAMHMPFALLGLGYLAAVLEKNNYEVDVIDCQVLKLSFEDFRSEISKRQPNIVGVTSSTLTYQSATQIGKDCKRGLPKLHNDCWWSACYVSGMTKHSKNAQN